MKTFKLIIFLLCFGGFFNLNAQGLYNIATLDEEEGVSPLQWSAGLDFTYDDAASALNNGIEWADNTIGGSAGFGWSDIEGNSETSYCIGAEYLHRITGDKQNPKGAGYLGAFASYHASNSDNFDQNLLRAGAKYSYFDPISAFNEVQLIYGANAFYETGKQEFSSSEDDISGFGASLYTGVNIRLCERASVGLEIPVVSYVSRTFESNGNEFDQDRFAVGLNKGNMVSATLRWVLDNLRILDNLPDSD